MVTSRRALLPIIVVVVGFSIQPAVAQNPADPVWGLYASGVGTIISAPDIDPCDITYTVAWVENRKINYNLGIGTVVTIYSDVTWNEAQAGLKRHGKYFDDEPDGIVKLAPCFSEDEEDIDLNGGNDRSFTLSGVWKVGNHTSTFTGSGNRYYYEGTNGNYKHAGYITSTDGRVFRGDVRDVDGFCCGNVGKIEFEVIDENTLRVNSKWWSPGQREPINWQHAGDLLKRVSGSAPPVAGCTFDTSRMSGSSDFCTSFVEYHGAAGRVKTVHIVNDAQFERGFTIPSTWRRGRYNTCEILYKEEGKVKTQHLRLDKYAALNMNKICIIKFQYHYFDKK